jgi:peptidoglycan/LPS O-acetylase OafA/YrhL
MNTLRGLAVLAVVVHHWLLFIPFQASAPLLSGLAGLIRDVAGTALNLFFILSGAGLTASYFKSRGSGFSWKTWALKRASKVVLPYLVFVALTFGLSMVSIWVFGVSAGKPYDFATLLSYLTFTRNFYEPGWGLNPTLWYMPVIIGLYAIFPLLIKMLEKYGPWLLMGFSALASYSSIILCFYLNYPVTHQSSFFPFYVILFSLGMLIGYSVHFHPHKLHSFVNAKMVFYGGGFYVLSWAMTRFWRHGDAFNDIFTAVGLFLPALYFAEWMHRHWGERSEKIFSRLSKESYWMYLIHGPIILYVALPVLKKLMVLPLSPILSVFMALIFCGIVFILAKLVAPSINHIVELRQKVGEMRS